MRIPIILQLMWLQQIAISWKNFISIHVIKIAAGALYSMDKNGVASGRGGMGCWHASHHVSLLEERECLLGPQWNSAHTSGDANI